VNGLRGFGSGKRLTRSQERLSCYAAMIQFRGKTCARLPYVLEKNAHIATNAGSKVKGLIDKAYFPCTANPTDTLVDLLNWTRQSKCADPRDKIFALLGMVDGGSQDDLGIVADYINSTVEVYCNVILRDSKQSGLLRLL
jgi:hypothetical protein